MKKRTLLLFAVGLLGLTSCGGSGAKVETLDKIGTSVLTADFVRVNVEANQVKKNTVLARPQLISQKITDNSGYSFVDFDSSYGGLIVTQNQAGYFGIYSTYLGQYIIEPCVNQFKMYDVDMVGRIVIVGFNNYYIAFDPFGNSFIIQPSQIDSYDSWSSKLVYDKVNNAHVAVTLTSSSPENKPVSFIYASDGSATSYHGEYDSNTPNENAQKEPAEGESYKHDWTALDEFGYPGYYLVRAENDYCTVFAGNSAKSSFYIDGKMIGIFNKKILTQQCYELPEDASDFSFSEQGVKYALETYYFDIETGKKEKANFNVCFSEEAKPLLNTNGRVEFFEISYSEITEQKVLGNKLSKIVDSGLVIRDDVTGCSIFDYQMISFEDNYYFYNKGNKVLFDPQLKPITALKEIEHVEIVEKANLVVGQYHGKYGALTPDGTVAIPFEYDDAYSQYADDDAMLFIKDGNAYRYKDKAISLVAYDCSFVSPNLFKGYGADKSSLCYFSSQKDLCSFEIFKNVETHVTTVSNVLGKYAIALTYSTNGQQITLNSVVSSDKMNIRPYIMDFMYKERTDL